MTTLETVRFFNAGSCRQLRYLADGRGWGTRAFHAVFVHLTHPVHGDLLIDSGYSPRFFDATRPFPPRFYRWLTPVRLDPALHVGRILRAHDLAPERLTTVFLSHFHADHIGGLRYLPEATFVHTAEAYERLRSLPPRQQLRHAFLPALLPDDFDARRSGISRASFRPGTGSLSGLRVYDYFDDGSVRLVDLPGHAMGHLGFLLDVRPRPVLYVVDACWNVEALRRTRELPALSRRVQSDYAAYRETLAVLRRIEQTGEYRLLACHCPHTQRDVENPGD